MKSLIRTAAVLGALALPLSVAGTAAAESLGETGQIAVGGDLDVRFTSSSTDEDGDEADILLMIAPSADYFIAPNLSVGAQVVFARDKRDDFFEGFGRLSFTDTSIGVAPRVGYVVGLGKISIWPRAGFSLAYVSRSADEPLPEPSSTVLVLNLFAPVNFHPTDHFFIGIGPSLDIDLYVSDDGFKETSFGVVSTVGGYF